MKAVPSGFEEIAHTADWALRVWAAGEAGLLAQAARGMYALMGVETVAGERVEAQLALPPGDRETRLVSFLAEALYLLDTRGSVFDQFDIAIDDDGSLAARLAGSRLLRRAKEIKAVTYHNLRVVETPRGLEATIVFDV